MKILLAIDDSKFSTAAIGLLLAQNDPNKARVLVLHVVERLETPYYPELHEPYPASLRDIKKGRLKAGKDLAERVAKRLSSKGFRVKTTVHMGDVRPTVVDVAERWHADMIVLGSHGRTGVKRLLLGSVSEYVARHAHCSVQIVRM
jgi:nucleotide-binding universal stress UspA family protein